MRYRILFFTVMLAVLVPGNAVLAQEDDTEYLVEIGAAAGTGFYMGDANDRLYRDAGLMGGIVARYRFSPRAALKADLAATHISGTTANMSDRTFPEDFDFSRTVFDLGVQMECNFLGYGTTTYNNCHRLTPYYLLGIGLTFAPKPAENVFAVNFPIGIGLKYKISDRLNVSLEWTMRFSTTDRLDMTGETGQDPLGINSGFMKNKDSYSFTMLMLTYDIFAKPCNCN